jgi:hypothetical protein
MTKKKPKSQHKDSGRPTVITDSRLHKLKEGFLRGYNNRIACIYAELKESTFYKYCKENPEYVEKKKGWQARPVTKALDNVNNSIEEGDVQTSKWLLERKLKDEFSLRNEVTGKDGEAIQTDNKITVEFIIPKIDPKDTKTEKTPKK